jgi:hypothetical protein
MEARNPYAGPIAPVEDPPLQGSAGAIFVGAMAGTGAAYMAMSLAGLAYVQLLLSQGVPIDHISGQLYGSPGFLVLDHALGFVGEAIGGYWVARLSTREPVAQACKAGAVNSLLSLMQFASPYVAMLPVWSRIASFVIPVVAFIAGAYWHANRLTPPSSGRL